MRTVVISLGGSLVSPEAGRVDTAFLKRFRALILKYVKRGQRFAIIVGGGRVARVWQESLRALHNPPQPSLTLREGNRSFLPLRLRGSERGLRNNLDWIGIRATQLNAELVRAMLGSVAYPKVVWNPHENVARFKVLVGAGFVSGHSSDYDAVVRAKTLGADTVLNLSNVDYVYDKDPSRHKAAKPLTTLSWAEYNKKFHQQWIPGANVPFDPQASKLAARSKIRVVFMSGRDLKNVTRFLEGKKFKGTEISA